MALDGNSMTHEEYADLMPPEMVPAPAGAAPDLNDLNGPNIRGLPEHMQDELSGREEGV